MDTTNVVPVDALRRNADRFRCDKRRAILSAGACVLSYVEAQVPTLNIEKKLRLSHCRGCAIGAQVLQQIDEQPPMLRTRDVDTTIEQSFARGWRKSARTKADAASTRPVPPCPPGADPTRRALLVKALRRAGGATALAKDLGFKSHTACMRWGQVPERYVPTVERYLAAQRATP